MHYTFDSIERKSKSRIPDLQNFPRQLTSSVTVRSAPSFFTRALYPSWWCPSTRLLIVITRTLDTRAQRSTWRVSGIPVVAHAAVLAGEAAVSWRTPTLLRSTGPGSTGHLGHGNVHVDPGDRGCVHVLVHGGSDQDGVNVGEDTEIVLSCNWNLCAASPDEPFVLVYWDTSTFRCVGDTSFIVWVMQS